MEDKELLGELAKLDAEFQAAEANDYDELPDGRYIGRVDSMTIERSKRTERLQVRTVLVVQWPNYVGRLQFHYRGLTGEDLGRLKADLHRWGFTQEIALPVLPSICEAMAGKLLAFKLVKNPKGQRLYLQEVVDKLPESA